MDTSPQDSTALSEFVDALLQCSGLLMLLVNHMTEYQASGASSPDAEPVPVVLKRLLEGTLEPVVADRPPQDVSTAARLLSRTLRALEEDIFFVPPPDTCNGGNRAQRRAARRRRP